MLMIPADLPPTERKLAEFLADGKPYTREEVRDAVFDEHCSFANIRVHLNRFRNRIRGRGYTVVTTSTDVFDGDKTVFKTTYQLRRRIAKSE